MSGIILKGITWDHSRGIAPLLAASQRYGELNPGVTIQWKKRTLQEFADYPIEILAKEYDLLIIDHPWVGMASSTGCVLPLEQYLPASYLDDQLKNSTGDSHLSYHYDNSQWALAIDAATPVASYRADLLSQHNIELPRSWDEVIGLARAGRVAVPGIPVDVLMNFYTFCIAMGKEPFQQTDEIIDRETGIAAIETMKELYSLVDREMFDLNPIKVAEKMTTGDQYWYCPFSYGYSNYSRKGFADHLLHYTDVVSYNGKKLRTTIGGTGLAVSASSAHREIAVDFAARICSGDWQKTIYVQHGGQPGHRSAWEDELANQLTHDYFKRVLPVMENGYVRPRYEGYLFFQDHAGDPLRKCLMENANPQKTLEEMNQLYRKSMERKKSKAIV